MDVTFGRKAAEIFGMLSWVDEADSDLRAEFVALNTSLLGNNPICRYGADRDRAYAHWLAVRKRLQQHFSATRPVVGCAVRVRYLGEPRVGLLDSIQDGRAAVCLAPSPHIVPSDNGELLLSTSGGPWLSCDVEALRPTGEVHRFDFWTWSHLGPRAHSGVYNAVEVSVFEAEQAA